MAAPPDPAHSSLALTHARTTYSPRTLLIARFPFLALASYAAARRIPPPHNARSEPHMLYSTRTTQAWTTTHYRPHIASVRYLSLSLSHTLTRSSLEVCLGTRVLVSARRSGALGDYIRIRRRSNNDMKNTQQNTLGVPSLLPFACLKFGCERARTTSEQCSLGFSFKTRRCHFALAERSEQCRRILRVKDFHQPERERAPALPWRPPRTRPPRLCPPLLCIRLQAAGTGCSGGGGGALHERGSTLPLGVRRSRIRREQSSVAAS